MTVVLRTTTVLVVVVVLLSSFGWSSRLAVPAYFYGDRGEGANTTAPSLPDAGQWGQLVGQGVAPPNTVAIAIANVAIGPGTAVMTQWRTTIRAAQASGVSVYGYVSTVYGSKDPTQVTREVDQWFTLYRVRNIFFDQVAADACPYYQLVGRRVRSRSGRVILNPGGVPAECNGALADVLVLYEGSCGQYSSFSHPDWVSKYQASVWHIVHSCQSRNDMAGIVASARADFLYVTDRLMVPSPYSALPSYWSQEVTEVAKTIVANCSLIGAPWGGPLQFRMELDANVATWNCGPVLSDLRRRFSSTVDCHTVTSSPIGNVYFSCSTGANQQTTLNTFVSNVLSGIRLGGIRVISVVQTSGGGGSLSGGVVAAIVLTVLFVVLLVVGSVWFIYRTQEKRKEEEIAERRLLEQWENDGTNI